MSAPERYGRTRVAKIKAAYDDLRATVAAGDMEAAQTAMDRYEQWADFAFAPVDDRIALGFRAGIEAAASEAQRLALIVTHETIPQKIRALPIPGNPLAAALALPEVRACLEDLDCALAMIQHAVRPGNDVFIEPDTKRKLSEAQARLAAMKEAAK